MEQITSLQVTFIASVWSPQEDLCVGLDTTGEWDTESPRIMGLIFPLIESHTVGCETWDCHWKIFWSELFLTIVSSCVVLCEYRHYRQFLAPSSYLWGGGRGERCCCHAMFGLDTIGVSGNTVFVITVWLVSSIVMRYLDCSFLGLPLFLAVKLAVVNCSVWLFCVIWYSCCCYSYCCCCCCCLSSCWCYCCLSNCFCSWISYCCCCCDCWCCCDSCCCSTVQYSTVQYSTVQYSTVQYSTVQYSTVQYSTVLCSTVQYSTVQYSTVQYSTVQYSTVQYSTVQYSTVLYSTVQHNTLQYNTLRYSRRNVDVGHRLQDPPIGLGSKPWNSVMESWGALPTTPLWGPEEYSPWPHGRVLGSTPCNSAVGSWGVLPTTLPRGRGEYSLEPEGRQQDTLFAPSAIFFANIYKKFFLQIWPGCMLFSNKTLNSDPGTVLKTDKITLKTVIFRCQARHRNCWRLWGWWTGSWRPCHWRIFAKVHQMLSESDSTDISIEWVWLNRHISINGHISWVSLTQQTYQLSESDSMDISVEWVWLNRHICWVSLTQWTGVS